MQTQIARHHQPIPTVVARPAQHENSLSRRRTNLIKYRMGYTLAEVPITFREREHGHSKISRAIVVEALYDVARWSVRDRFGRLLRSGRS